MADPVTIAFETKGVTESIRALETIERKLINIETAGTKAAEKGSRTRVLASQTEAKERDAAYAKLVRETEKWQAQELRATEKTAKEKVRAEQAAARQLAQIREQSALMAGRYAEQAASAEIAARKRVSQALGNAVGTGAGRVLGGLGSLAMGAVTIGGGFALADAARSQFSFGKATVGLQNSAALAGSALSKDDILSKVAGAQAASGIGRESLVKGWQEYVKLASDPKGGGANLAEFAKLAKATGTDFSEMMSLAGNLKVQNRNLDDAGMMKLLRNIIGQGGAGAMEIEDLAKEGATITATAGMYGGDQAENQGKLLGLSQIARRVAKDPAEAAMAVKHFGEDLAHNADKLRDNTGVIVKDKTGALKDPSEILASMFEKTGKLGKAGMVGALTSAGIGERSIKIIEALQSTYNAAGGGKAGVEAVRQDVLGLENKGLTGDKVDEMLKRVMEDPAERLDLAFQRIQTTLATSLAPALERFAAFMTAHQEDISGFITKLAGFASFVGDHLPETLVAALTLSIEKEMAQAALGEWFKGLVEKMMGGGGEKLPTSAPSGTGGLLTRAGEVLGGAAGVLGGVVAPVAGSLAALGLISHQESGWAEEAKHKADRFAEKNAGSEVIDQKRKELQAKVDLANKIGPQNMGDAAYPYKGSNSRQQFVSDTAFLQELNKLTQAMKDHNDTMKKPPSMPTAGSRPTLTPDDPKANTPIGDRT